MKKFLIGCIILANAQVGYCKEMRLSVTYPDKEIKKFAIAPDKNGLQQIVLRSKQWRCDLWANKESSEVGKSSVKIYEVACSMDNFKKTMMKSRFVCGTEADTPVELDAACLQHIEVQEMIKDKIQSHSIDVKRE